MIVRDATAKDGLHNARQLIRDKETIIVDGTRGVIIVDPDPRILEEYELKKSQIEIDRSKLKLLKSTRATTLDRVKIDLLANIEERRRRGRSVPYRVHFSRTWRHAIRG